MIRKKVLTAQSRQKSYADQRRRELTFAVGDKVFVKVSPTKSVFPFWKEGEAQPQIRWSLRSFEPNRRDCLP